MTAPVRTGIPDARSQLANLPLAVILLAPGMRIAAANPLAEQFFGQGARRLIAALPAPGTPKGRG